MNAKELEEQYRIYSEAIKSIDELDALLNDLDDAAVRYYLKQQKLDRHLNKTLSWMRKNNFNL